MYQGILLAVIAVSALALAVISCGGKSGPKIVVAKFGTTVPTAARLPAGNFAASSSSAPAGSDLDVTFSGALQGHWGNGDRSTGLTCTAFGNNQVQISIFGVLNNTNYGLGVRQDGYAAASYAFPATGSPAAAPWAQITTNSNSKAQWDLQGASGKGNLTLTGGVSSQVGGTIDADLADRQGGAAVHVKGSFKCKIGGT